MKPRPVLVLVNDVADVDSVADEVVELGSVEGRPAMRSARRRETNRLRDAVRLQLIVKQPDVSKLSIAVKNAADERRVFFNNSQTAARGPITDRGYSPPSTFPSPLTGRSYRGCAQR